MKGFINILYAAYLGFILSALCDINYLNWKLYAVIIPTIILVELRVKNNKED